ncbi:MAG: cytochrome c peroxidase [SAR324 cluster bacterium]|nr:cytochrome c peroxidase [SAR324 cluster bacterium]
MMKKTLLIPFSLFLLLWAGNIYAFEPLGVPDPDEVEFESDFDINEKVIDLGKTLFFDNRLSINKSQSCATCHNPDLGFGDGMAKGIGALGGKLGRNVPHIYNLSWNNRFFWDGRAKTLEEQALGPIQSKAEMNMDIPTLVRRLQQVPAYRLKFKKAFGDEAITDKTIAAALAAFEATITVTNTPFDQFTKGNHAALSPSAKRGLKLFKKKARCVKCHDGANFTDVGFHNIGVKDLDKTADVGRYKIDPAKNLRGAFKTPGLRNTAFTAPYMHNGSLGSLEEVVRFYNRGGEKSPNKDKLMKKLNLSEQEIFDLVAFLGALSEPLNITRPVIP